MRSATIGAACRSTSESPSTAVAAMNARRVCRAHAVRPTIAEATRETTAIAMLAGTWTWWSTHDGVPPGPAPVEQRLEGVEAVAPAEDEQHHGAQHAQVAARVRRDVEARRRPSAGSA
jgi:hypothetical protein